MPSNAWIYFYVAGIAGRYNAEHPAIHAGYSREPFWVDQQRVDLPICLILGESISIRRYHSFVQDDKIDDVDAIVRCAIKMWIRVSMPVPANGYAEIKANGNAIQNDKQTGQDQTSLIHPSLTIQ